MAAVLQQLLERAELAKLPRAVQGKLERFLGDQQGEIDGLRARHERFKVDSGECGRRARGAAAVPALRGGEAARAERGARCCLPEALGGCPGTARPGGGWERGLQWDLIAVCLSLWLLESLLVLVLLFSLAEGR